MALDGTWAISAVKFTHASAPVILSQITRRTVNRNVRTVINYGAGAFQPSYVAVMTAEPVVSFETTEIGRVISACGFAGAGIGNAGTDLWTGVELYYTLKSNKGSRGGASVHVKQTSAFGYAVMRRVRARWGQEATAEVEIFCGSTDGEAQPLSVTTGVSLPTNLADQKYTLGYCALNGTAAESMDVEIDSGAVIEAKGSSASVYNTNINYKRFAPSAKLKTFDPSRYSTHDLDGTTINSSNCDFYLRKLASGGGARTASGTAAHIRFRFLDSQGVIVAGDDTGNESDDLDADFSVIGVTNGTNDAVSITNGIIHP